MTPLLDDKAVSHAAPERRPGRPEFKKFTPRTARRRSLYAASAAAFRWVHIYVSMLGFAALMFFSFTGITLNHPTWFGASQVTRRDTEGSLPDELAAPLKQATSASEGVEVDKLNLAEWLREQHRLRGRVVEFEVNPDECLVVFKGPGYAADVWISNETAEYSVSESTYGAVAILNDLHKGRDSGAAWSLAIDISAAVALLLSLSGFGLLFYLKRRRVSGILTAVAGTVLLVIVWAVWVP